ncbi:MAG: UDP-N-acetylglucosamine--N-acetylmuramyl-(pentapeptide) pyrophosphoryl-undecaprenol N-acetylglucosamine transferase [Candidatus Daviesbacteria bacterium]|nr:UDP-N-acetylglucosamine--N-acetylmuramyl-(pentapeptide) pyrophosphoryl-undecaprenol N-acetylglucosamine transferase [Candidatus Daviesbacteria bacterium]
MKVLLTGTHFTPAVAVIEELKKRKNIQIVYVGRKTTMEGDQVISVESTILPKLGVKFIPITTGRLQRNFTILTLLSLLKIPIGFIQAFFIILSEKPNVILSFGGYVAVPVVIMGWLWSIPIIVHEQTLVSGLANKITALFADKIAVGYLENEFMKNPKAILTGNPLRKEILNPKKTLSSDFSRLFQVAKIEKLPVILITGGNQGSHLINEAVEGCLQRILRYACVIHQTGDSKYGDYEKLVSTQSDRYIVKKFIKEGMGTILSQVDLIVSRAGINTLTESLFFKKPMLVIPLPHIYQNEQVRNAKFFERLNQVKILYQNELNADSLNLELESILKDLSKWQKQITDKDLPVDKSAASKVAIETILLA